MVERAWYCFEYYPARRKILEHECWKQSWSAQNSSEQAEPLFIAFRQFQKRHPQWRGESKAAAEAARLMAPPPPPPPPPVIHFCLLVWDACHVVSTTFNYRRSLRNTFGWLRALKTPQQLHGRVLVEVQGLAPWKLQRICILRYLNLGLILPNNTWMVLHFFQFHCSTKSQENPKGPKFSILRFLIRKKCVFSIVLAG